MDKKKFLITVLLLIVYMQSLTLYLPSGDRNILNNTVVSRLWVAGFYPERLE